MLGTELVLHIYDELSKLYKLVIDETFNDARHEQFVYGQIHSLEEILKGFHL
ncbi:hypothetical protein [PinkBerry-associated phage LS06-2018-MD08]|nr:hypothetical protein [PinkBerry-associated phage LS06-2018-MD08]